MVVGLDLLELEIDPTILDESLDGGGTRETDGLLLLIERSLYVVLDLLSFVSQSAGSFVGVGREGSGTSLGLTLE